MSTEEDLRALCKKLASSICDLEDLFYEIIALPEEEQTEAWANKFPTIQGIRNKMALRKFSESFDEDAAQRAFVEEVLSD